MHLVQLSAGHLGALASADVIQPASGMTSLAWLLVALPLLGAAILLLGGWRTNAFGPALATGLSWASFGLGALIFFAMLGRSGAERAQSLHLFSWVPAGSFQVEAGMLVDPLSMAFVLLVTFVGSLILVYSLALCGLGGRGPGVIPAHWFLEPQPGLRHSGQQGVRRQQGR